MSEFPEITGGPLQKVSLDGMNFMLVMKSAEDVEMSPPETSFERDSRLLASLAVYHLWVRWHALQAAIT